MTRPLRIAMIGHKRIPGREGGVEVVVESLATHMAAEGHSVTVYNRAGGGLRPSKAFRGVRVITVPTIYWGGLDALVSTVFATVHALFSRYDVIHYHAEGPCAVLWLPRLFGIRTVATIHGLDWTRAKWGRMARRFLRFGEAVAARHAGAVVVLTQSAQRYFQRCYACQAHVIPNGVDTPDAVNPSILRDGWGLTPGRYVLFLARIVPEKGLELLLRAFAGIETDMQLVIVGDFHPGDAYAKQMAALADADPRVVRTGFASGEALDALYAGACVYVLPSTVEGMPMTLLEAMAHGTRCLASGIEENVATGGACAEFFRQGDIADLRGKLAGILCGDTPRPCDAETMRRTVLAAHDWDAVTRATLAVYRDA